jgi:hypothetical protein
LKFYDGKCWNCASDNVEILNNDTSIDRFINDEKNVLYYTV